jgi:type I restriction enzyme S subunit
MNRTGRAAPCREIENYRLEPGDILFSHINSLEHIGKVAIYRGGLPLYHGMNLLLLRCGSELNADYLYYWLSSSPGRRASALLARPAVSQASINTSDLKSISIPVPPVIEQKAIAEALSDADAYVESLDQLIEKKRDLKQGVMQVLLTGKRRLPGFSGAWETRTLGELGEIAGSGVDKKVHAGEAPVRLVNYMDAYRRDFIYSQNLEHWVTASASQSRRCSVRKGDIFFTPSSETRDDIGQCAVAMEDVENATYSYHVVRFRLHMPWDLKFRAYAFKTRAFLSQAETLCDGSGTRYVISLPKFRGMSITVPPVAEQIAIGSALFDIDAEIDKLVTTLDKARAIKQGMMQELLTGTIRLV